MRRITIIAALAAALTALAAPAALAKAPPHEHAKLRLRPSTPALAKCMPRADVRVRVDLTTDKLGFDTFRLTGRGLPPRRDYTVFLLEQPGSPFGAAEYIGDFHTNRRGNTSAKFRLIVEEAFSFTLAPNGVDRVRADLNHVGAWFADPKADDFCLGPNSPVTGFDGDAEAGVQALNSAGSRPLP